MPRAWYRKIANYLLFCGCSLSSTDSSLLMKHTSKGMVIACLYIDDLIVIDDDVDEIGSVHGQLSI